MATADVVVGSETGGRYLCDRESDRSGWRCGRCQQGILVAAQLGSRCPVCGAEVIATRGGRSWVWFALLALVALLLGWVGMTWWR